MSDLSRLFTRTLLAVLAALGCASPVLATPASSTDQRISVTSQGEGPDVLLIPGLASSAQVWKPTATRLAAHYRVHSVQVLGFAGTPAAANATGPVIAPVASAVHDYIAAHHLAPIAIIGHSMGGLIGLELALDHAADVRRLMIVDSLPFFGAVFGAPDIGTLLPRATAMRDAMMTESQTAYAANADGMTHMLVRSTGAQAAAVTTASAASDHRVVAQALYDDMTTDLRRTISGIKAPLTVLYPWDPASGLSQAATDSFYHAQYAALPGITFHRVDMSRHFIMIDQPQNFAHAVDQFLAQSF